MPKWKYFFQNGNTDIYLCQNIILINPKTGDYHQNISYFGYANKLATSFP